MAMRTRSSRATSNCLPGRVRATMRRFTWSTWKLSTPITVGASSSSGRSVSSWNASSPTLRSRSLAWATSTPTGRGTSTTARAQSRDRLVTPTIWPLPTVTTSPVRVRRRVVCRPTSSIVPVAPSKPAAEMWTRSP